MTYKEFAEKAHEIIDALKKGDYEESLDAPNFAREVERDGKICLIVFDADGPQSSSYCGCGDYKVCGETFSYEFDFYGETDPEGRFFDLAESLEGSPDDIDEDVDDLVDDIKGEIRCLAPDFEDVYSQADAYAKAMGIQYDKVYWYEDEDCPEYDEE